MGMFDDVPFLPGRDPPSEAAPSSEGHQPLRITIHGGADNMTPGPPSGGMFDSVPFLPGRGPAPEQPQVSTGEALARHAQSGLASGFNDELVGAAKASGVPEWDVGALNIPIGVARLLYDRLIGGTGEATRAYENGRNSVRERMAAAKEQHPVASAVGEIGGMLGGALVAPGATLARGAGIVPRAVNAGLTGAAYGGLAGAGEGEGAGDTLSRAAGGAAIGAGAGAVAAPLVQGLVRGGTGIVNAVRDAINPNAGAARRVAAALEADYPHMLDPMQRAADVVEHPPNGAPVILADAGRENTRALARSAKNTSPTGAQELQDATGPRFEDQQGRFGRLIARLTGGPNASDAVLIRDQLEALARQQNRPAYARAYAAGDRPVISPELERLIGHPDVEDAMRSAVRNGKGYAINEGHGGFNSRVEVTPDGRVNFNNGPSGTPTYPNVQYWDYVQRELASAEGRAVRAGGGMEATRIGGARRALNAELDNIVPEFGQARRGAATFFGADDALTAGQNFVTSTMENTEARQAAARMTPAERQLFAHGYASDIVKKVREIPVAQRSRLISQAFLNSPAASERMEIALGPDGARRIEAFLRIERMMDQTRQAVSGNSTTVQQLATAGMAGGAGTMLATGDYSPSNFGIGAIVGALARGGAQRINGRIAEQVGRLLASDNPDAIRQAAEMAVRNPRLMDAVRRADALLARTAGSSAPSVIPKNASRADQDQ